MPNAIRQRFLAIVIVLASNAALVTPSATLAAPATTNGCMDQWLFNGVWRVRVTDVEPYSNGGPQIGWQVTEVWRNGTTQEVAPNDSVMTDEVLELGHGTIKATDSTGGTLSQQSVVFNSFPPAGEFTYKQVFIGQNFVPTDKPKGLTILFNGVQLAQMTSKPQFSTSKYDFHFDLGCKATGAAAQAQGGSTQLAATPGCLNEWLSNGVWKMRVNSIVPRLGNPNDPKSAFGWTVSQTWVNASGRGVLPFGLSDKGTAFVGTRVTDEYVATQSGKTGSSANAVGGFQLGAKPGYDWAPGESWTFQQLFVWGSFDPTDKPMRLLVTFDDKTQNSTPGVPHYRKPADFRIDLTCTK